MDQEIGKGLREEQLWNFQKFLSKEERASATISKYSHDIRVFYEYLIRQSKGARQRAEGCQAAGKEEPGEQEPGEEVEAQTPREGAGAFVTKEKTVKFKNWLLESYHVRSANSMLTAVNRFLDFLGWQEYKVKLIKVQRQICREERKELQKEEYRRLVKAAGDSGNERLAMILKTLCGLGLRISELKFITVESIKNGKLQVLNKGKNRMIFVSGKLQKQLLRYVKKRKIASGAVFITRTGKQMDRSNIWREMKKLYRKARVERQKIFPHNLRHLFARTFYEMRKDVVKLADIMGHSSIETTRIYTATSGKEYRRQLEALGLVI